jgi:hypothetical protein
VVILLDTNQLEHAQPPDGALLSMLRTLARETGHRLGLPEIALEEHLTHHRHAVELALRDARRATSDLRRLAGFVGSEDVLVDIETAVADRRAQLDSIFEVVPTPDFASHESLLREARRQPPAKVSFDGPGAGGRDVAIWLTALSAALACEDDTYFVSADTAAFGRSQLKPELLTELDETLGAHASAFHYCHGLDALLGELAFKVERPMGPDLIANSAAVRAAVTAALEEPDLAWELPFGESSGGVSANSGALELTSSRHEVCYQIGDTTWACARTTWRGSMSFERMSYGPEGRLILDPPRTFAFKVTTTLVMQLDPQGAVAAAEVAARSRAFGFEELWASS